MLERSVDDVVVDEVRHGHAEVGRAVHLTLDGIHGSLVAGPCTAGDTVVNIPEEHLADVAAALLGAIDYHTEATVDDLAPAYTATVVDAHPRSATEGVADDVLYGHVGAELRTIVDIGGLAEGRVGTGDIVVVTTQNDGCLEAAILDGLVEGQRDAGTALTVGIEDAGL